MAEEIASISMLQQHEKAMHQHVIPMQMGIQSRFFWIPASRLRVARYGGRRKVAGMTEPTG